MDKKEKDNFLDNLSIDFNYKNHNVGNNKIVNISIENESKNLNDEKNSDEEDINISKSYVSNINEKNIDEIVMERGEFNIFPIKTNDYQFGLKKYFLKNKQDLESIDAHLNNMYFGEENFNKQNKKNKD